MALSKVTSSDSAIQPKRPISKAVSDRVSALIACQTPAAPRTPRIGAIE
jgi:hypothetical protein